jgi:hypothetical protein
MKQKENIAPVERGAETEARVSVYIPSEGTGAFLEGAVNGVTFRIPTDTVVELPRRIADVIAESRRGILAGSRDVEAYLGTGGRRIG